MLTLKSSGLGAHHSTAQESCWAGEIVEREDLGDAKQCGGPQHGKAAFRSRPEGTVNPEQGLQKR